MSRSGHRRAINTGELSMRSLLEFFGNVVGVWRLIVVFIKDTGEKADGENLVV